MLAEQTGPNHDCHKDGRKCNAHGKQESDNGQGGDSDMSDIAEGYRFEVEPKIVA